MPFDINGELNKATRFYWPESEEEWVDLRLSTEEVMNESRKSAGIKTGTKYIFNPKTKRMDSVNDVNIDEDKMQVINDALLDYQIKDWHIVDASGNEIPCNLENKKRLMYGSIEFSKWINKNIGLMQEAVDKIEEEEIKNF